LGAVFTVLYWAHNAESRSKISYGVFRHELAAGNIEKIEVQGAQVNGEFVAARATP
jgi:hypothetical protein